MVSYPVFCGDSRYPTFTTYMINVKRVLEIEYQLRGRYMPLPMNAPPVQDDDPEPPKPYLPQTHVPVKMAESPTIPRRVKRTNSHASDLLPFKSSVALTILSCLITWGLNDSIDKFCQDRCGIRLPSNNLTMVFRGAAGIITVRQIRTIVT